MWVADMNFATAPSIVQAIKDRADHPAFGYFAPSAAYYESIIDIYSNESNVVWHNDRQSSKTEESRNKLIDAWPTGFHQR